MLKRIVKIVIDVNKALEIFTLKGDKPRFYW